MLVWGSGWGAAHAHRPPTRERRMRGRACATRLLPKRGLRPLRARFSDSPNAMKPAALERRPGLRRRPRRMRRIGRSGADRLSMALRQNRPAGDVDKGIREVGNTAAGAEWGRRRSEVTRSS
jgi:hypothetical protein